MEQPINILIVDDEPKNLTVLETVLSDPGYRLVRAESGEKALLALVTEEFALLILDVRMPGMTGFELAQTIRARAKTSRVPIIFLTAYYNEDQHVLEGYGVGAVDYLHKPVNTVVLRSKVAVFAELYRKERALRQEIAERRRAEEELRSLNASLDRRVDERTRALHSSEARLSTVLHNTPVLVYELDKESRFVQVNRRFEQLFQVKDDQVRGRSVFEVLPRDLAERFDASNREVLDSGAAIELEESFPHASDERTYVSVKVPRLDAAGLPDGIVGISTDITERKKAEAALANESHRKDEFLAMLSHELRNPLAPLRVAVHMLKVGASESEAPAQKQAREIIDRQVGNLTKLVEDLLEVSRVVNGRIRLERRVVDLNDILRTAIESTKPLMKQHGHELVSHLCDEGTFALADPLRLEAVFINLLNNAAKYTPDGGKIEVWCEGVTSESGEMFAQVRVRDSGVGIDGELLPRIFDLFTQADRSLARAQGGLGIGLSLSHRIVAMHGGEILAVSDGPGRGAEFTVKLQLMPPPQRSEPRSAPTEEPAAPTPGTRLLLVDDNADYVTMLEASLTQSGYAVRTAYNGFAAIDVAASWRPEVILLDIGLPGLDGYEVAHRIRRHSDVRDARLIAVTGYGREIDKALARDAGFDGHLTKPVDVADVVKLIASLAGRSGIRV